jgi:hypothetical protein
MFLRSGECELVVARTLVVWLMVEHEARMKRLCPEVHTMWALYLLLFPDLPFDVNFAHSHACVSDSNPYEIFPFWISRMHFPPMGIKKFWDIGNE